MVQDDINSGSKKLPVWAERNWGFCWEAFAFRMAIKYNLRSDTSAVTFPHLKMETKIGLLI